MRSRGYSLTEVLMTTLVMGVVLGGVFTGFAGMWTNQTQATAMPAAQEGAKEMAIVVAEAFRGSVNCLSTDSGCTVGAPIQNASSTGCTVYSRSGGTLVQSTYAVNNGSFQITTGGTTTTLTTGATLAITYYSSSTYNTTSLTTFTPTAATAANLLGVQIVATVTQSGQTDTYTTYVRLRNGP